MKISLITATYNSQDTIESCLDSVANQTYGNIEHLIIDGNSSDRTLEIVKGYSDRKYNIRLRSEPDSGIYDALNKGIQWASGDIIGFVHSDDVLSSKETIELIVGYFMEEKIDGVYGDLKYVDAQDIFKTIRYWKSSNFTPSKLANGWMPAHPTLFLRRAIYEDYGMFNTNLKIAADYEFVLRIFRNSNLRFEYIPEVLVLMRVGGESNKTLMNILAKSKEDYYALKSNDIKFPILTLLKKNVQKIPQWIMK